MVWAVYVLSRSSLHGKLYIVVVVVVAVPRQRHLAMYPMPVSMHDMPVFSNTTPELLHHSLNSKNGPDV